MSGVPPTISTQAVPDVPIIPDWIPTLGTEQDEPIIQTPQEYVPPTPFPPGRPFSESDRFGPRLPLTPPVGDEDLSVRLLLKRYPFAPIIALSDLDGRLPKVDLSRSYGVMFMGSDGLPYWLPSWEVDPSEAIPMSGAGASTERKSLISNATASMIIPGHRAVIMAGDGSATLASASKSSMPGVTGISKNASDIGGSVQIVTSGEMESDGWNWVPGTVFLGENGTLTQTPISSGWLYAVGQALASSIMIVRPTPNSIWLG